MPTPNEPREEALRSLDERIDAFEARRAPKPAISVAKFGTTQGYRFLGEVVGGVLGGVGFGWLIDRFAGTQPFGLIGGLLIGTGLSTFVAIRGAGQWAKTESAKAGESPSVPDDEDD